MYIYITYTSLPSRWITNTPNALESSTTSFMHMCVLYSQNCAHIFILFCNLIFQRISFNTFPLDLESESVGHSIVTDSLQPHGLEPAWLLCPWDFPGKNTEVHCHSLLQEGRPFSWVSWPRNRTWVSCIAGRFFTTWATREAMQETQVWPPPRVGKIPWRGEWLPTPVFLPGGFHGQRRLTG